MWEQTIKLTIAYDGTDFHGWQIQPGMRTIQGCLCEAVSRVCETPTHVQAAGRTDAGVHAKGQAGVFKTAASLPLDALIQAINRNLPRDIVVRKAQIVSSDFDVIRHVTQKHYQYTLHLSHIPDVRTARFCWLYPGRLNIEAMHQAAEMLVGEHDFRSFACDVKANQNTVRMIDQCSVRLADDSAYLLVDIKGPGFLRHMVRIIVGTLVDIGKGHWSAAHIMAILTARDRKAAGYLAPPEGLCLMAVDYPSILQ